MFKRYCTRWMAIVMLSGIVPLAHGAEPSSFTVQVTGKGEPMILIPGLGSPGAVWDSAVAHFSARYRCIVINIAGFAGQAHVSGELLTRLKDELAAYIVAHDLKKPVVVGHSLGGFLALRLAAERPDLVGPLVVVDTLPALGAMQMPDATPEQLQAMAARMRTGMLQSPEATREEGMRRSVASMVTGPQDRERVVEWGLASDRRTVIEAMHDIMAADLREEVSQIRSRTLVLGTWIAYKDVAPRATIEAAFRSQFSKLQGVDIEMSDTARHFVMLDDPRWMFARMDEFLK